MANNLNSNPIVIDTLAAGDNVITANPLKIFMVELFGKDGAAHIVLKDSLGDYKVVLDAGTNLVDRQEWHFPLWVNSLTVLTGWTFPAGSYLLIYV